MGGIGLGFWLTQKSCKNDKYHVQYDFYSVQNIKELIYFLIPNLLNAYKTPSLICIVIGGLTFAVNIKTN